MDVETRDPAKPPDGATVRVDVVRFRRSAPASAEDEVAVERPLSVHVGGEPLVVTMRTPGHDDELVMGFLVAEGLARSATDVEALTPRVTPDREDVVAATIRSDVTRLASGPVRRGTLATASCGVCGRNTVDDLLARCGPVASDATFHPRLVSRLTDLLSTCQPLFARTGGLHAAAVVDRAGDVLVTREDVGRHNAVDKAIGRMVLDGRVPLGKHALVVSGRTSFEIVQKAIAAGIPLVAGVSAPSSLAIGMAARAGVTLVGFARGEDFNVYATPGRITV